MQRKVIDTGDGSKTLFIPKMEEQYHSTNGALNESEYVFIDKGFRHHAANSPVVFEVGFGTGLNALLTAQEAEAHKRATTFISIEKYPISDSEIKALDYGALFSEESKVLFSALHQAPWEEKVKISEYFHLLKINADLKSFSFKNRHFIDVVYFDAFGPDKQPKMWRKEIFTKIYDACANNAVFVTYSAKGEIRRQLRDCGFLMERLPGPPGKDKCFVELKQSRNKQTKRV
jgi:tRNA U34 5-methylaminomethyl-2-thiouridine-forming methyltransferase MnmC